MSFEILALIPARGGSKGVPRKNLAPIGGKPLIKWSLEAARAAPSINRLIVSTDAPEIAAVASSAGIEVPFLRPSEFASDTSLAVDVICHALDWLRKNEGYQPDFVLWLQPTSPLRTTDDIEGSVTLLREKSADSVVSVCPAEHHPAWMKRVNDDGLLLPWRDEETFPQRRQQLSPLYRLNGAIYLTRREILLKKKNILSRSHLCLCDAGGKVVGH
jgi:CMP-N-acetylneuraminic acid synthetase